MTCSTSKMKILQMCIRDSSGRVSPFVCSLFACGILSEDVGDDGVEIGAGLLLVDDNGGGPVSYTHLDNSAGVSKEEIM